MPQPKQLTLNFLPPAADYSWDNFFISSANQQACNWLKKWPAWPYFCLIIHGPKGSGKTHLANLWLKKSKGYLLKIEDLINPLQSKISPGLAILIEDVDSQNFTATNLLHLFNHLQANKGYLLLTSEQHLTKWNLKLSDLKSRLKACPAVEISQADDHLLNALLLKGFAEHQLNVDKAIITYLLRHTCRSFANMQLIISKIINYSKTYNKKITVPVVKSLLNLSKIKQ